MISAGPDRHRRVAAEQSIGRMAVAQNDELGFEQTFLRRIRRQAVELLRRDRACRQKAKAYTSGLLATAPQGRLPGIVTRPACQKNRVRSQFHRAHANLADDGAVLDMKIRAFRSQILGGVSYVTARPAVDDAGADSRGTSLRGANRPADATDDAQVHLRRRGDNARRARLGGLAAAVERDSGNESAIHQLNIGRVAENLEGARNPDATEGELPGRWNVSAAAAPLSHDLDIAAQEHAGIFIDEVVSNRGLRLGGENPQLALSGQSDGRGPG